MKLQLFLLTAALSLPIISAAENQAATPKETVLPNQPLGLKVSVKMVGPYMEAADLQIICLFKHKRDGDTYQGAAKDTDTHLNGVLSALRDRGEFVGELGETFLFSPAKGSIPAKRFMVIGLGEEKELSLQSLRVIGSIAARESVRLRARHVAWAPVIRDEGNSTIEVGEGDRVFIEQVVLAYDTEKRLQSQGLAPDFSIETIIVEAGPAFFDSAVKQIGEGLAAITGTLSNRTTQPYSKAAAK